MTISQRQLLVEIMEIHKRIWERDYPKMDKMEAILEASRRMIFLYCSYMIYQLGATIEFNCEKGGLYYTDNTWFLPGYM
jgi:hypothetical protein